MEDLINEIREYLPINYSESSNNEYIEYLVDACDKNSLMEKDQFAFIAFHMLYMSYVFKVVWQSNQTNHSNIKNLLNNYNSRLGLYENPFDLSIIPEKESVKLLKCFGFHINKLSEFSSPIDNRDHCAHPSGFVQYKKEDITQLADRELNHIKVIQNKSTPMITKLFLDFFSENFKPSDVGSLFPSGLDSVDVFLRQNLLSIKDIDIIVNNGYGFLTKESENIEIIYLKVFFLLLCAKYDELTEQSYQTFLTHFPKLLYGFSKQDEKQMRTYFRMNYLR